MYRKFVSRNSVAIHPVSALCVPCSCCCLRVFGQTWVKSRSGLRHHLLGVVMDKETFKAKTTTNINGCWIWNGEKTSQGYGMLKINGKRKRAHRFSYQLFVGEIAGGLCVCHRCDVPSCVNPEHLFAGTHSDNMADCVAKGRHPSSKPGNRFCRRFVYDEAMKMISDGATEKQVAEHFGVTLHTVQWHIWDKSPVKRKRFLTTEERRTVLALRGSKTQRQIASMFGITRVAVSLIHSGKTKA